MGSEHGRPLFLADNNVGRLGRWLRALGYDAEFRPLRTDAELVDDALREGRILLTRDEDMTHRRPVAAGSVRAVLLRHDRVEDQVRQVDAEVGLDRSRWMTRCLECNVALEPRPRDLVAERVPPFVRATQARYSECTSCRRIYWAGTHWMRMTARLHELVASA